MIDLPFEGGKVEGSWKYSRRERVPKARSRGEETITEPINFRIGEFHTIVVGKCCPTCGRWHTGRDGSKGTCWGGGGKANLTNSRRSMLRFDQLELVNVEVWPTRVGQCWGLTNSSRSMLRFDQLESVNVEVWPTRVGQCWGLTNSNSFIS